MVNVEEYKEGTSEWLRGDDVQVGDKLLILNGGYFDDETFTDKSGKGKLYFCTSMRLIRTGVEKNVRLGSENVKRIAEKFGDDTAAWLNRQVVVDEIKVYKGLGQKGIIFRPVAETLASGVPATPAAAQVPLQPRGEPTMTRGEALERAKNWPAEDREAWIKYLKAQGKLRD